MKFLILFLPIILIACQRSANDSSICADYSNALFVSEQTYSCLNTADDGGSYSLIAFSGGDTSITDPAAYKADLEAKFDAAKLRATKVIYFSSPKGKASADQYAAAQEAVNDKGITTYDLYSMSIADPDSYDQFIINIIASYL